MGFGRGLRCVACLAASSRRKASGCLAENSLFSSCGFRHANRFCATRDPRFSSCLHTSPIHTIARQVVITDYRCTSLPQEVSAVLTSRKDLGRRIPSGSSFLSIVIRPSPHTGQSCGSRALHWPSTSFGRSGDTAWFAPYASSFRQHSSLSLRQRLARRP